MRRERRQPTRRELEQVTSRRPVVKRIKRSDVPKIFGINVCSEDRQDRENIEEG